MERFPLAADPHLHEESVALREQAERLVRRRLLDARGQPYRPGEGLPAEADVGDVVLPVDRHPQQHVRARQGHAVRYVPHHARGQAGDAKAERIECRLEQQVVLEAVAAAPAAHELLLQRGKIEPHRTAQEGIEILERNRQRVAQMERAQRLQRRRARSAVADAPQIGVEIDPFGHRGAAQPCLPLMNAAKASL